MWRRSKPARDTSDTGFDLAAVIDDDNAFRTWYEVRGLVYE